VVTIQIAAVIVKIKTTGANRTQTTRTVGGALIATVSKAEMAPLVGILRNQNLAINKSVNPSGRRNPTISRQLSGKESQTVDHKKTVVTEGRGKINITGRKSLSPRIPGRGAVSVNLAVNSAISAVTSAVTSTGKLRSAEETGTKIDVSGDDLALALLRRSQRVKRLPLGDARNLNDRLSEKGPIQETGLPRRKK
jgi:hypothetical protein